MAEFYAMNMQANFYEVRDKSDHDLGDVALGSKDTIWVYGQASEAVTGTCTLNTSTFAITDAAGNHTAVTNFASGDFGWVRQTTPISP